MKQLICEFDFFSNTWIRVWRRLTFNNYSLIILNTKVLNLKFEFNCVNKKHLIAFFFISQVCATPVTLMYTLQPSRWQYIIQRSHGGETETLFGLLVVKFLKKKKKDIQDLLKLN